jgi:hypothetical protein
MVGGKEGQKSYGHCHFHLDLTAGRANPDTGALREPEHTAIIGWVISVHAQSSLIKILSSGLVCMGTLARSFL